MLAPLELALLVRRQSHAEVTDDSFGERLPGAQREHGERSLEHAVILRPPTRETARPGFGFQLA